LVLCLEIGFYVLWAISKNRKKGLGVGGHRMANFRIAKTAKTRINQAFPQFRCYVATASKFIGRKKKKGVLGNE